MFIDIVEIGFRIANGQILSIFDSYLPMTHQYFCFLTITSVNVKRMFTKLGVYIDIMRILFWIANRQISSIFDRVIFSCNTS